ncbi:Type I restriction-modification system, restriction subunit R, partial [hydrothermal vent metagenome]
MEKLKTLIILSVFLNLLLSGCQDNESILGIDNQNSIINPKYFYSGQWEFKGLDTLDNYEFELNVEFNQDKNNEFPKILVNKDS